MLKKSTLFISIAIVLTMTNCSHSHLTSAVTPPHNHYSDIFKLDEYRCYSASVLPIFTENKKLNLLLTREAEGNKHPLGKWHKYDDCSGSTEQEDIRESKEKQQTLALISAAREFLEEGMLEEIFGWNLEQVIEYIKQHTKYVIIHSKDKNPCDPHSRTIRNVTYVVDFDEHKDQFFNGFYDARKKVLARYKKEGIFQKHLRTNAEKDKPAKVDFDDFKTAILAPKDSNMVQVNGLVLNPRTNKFQKERITLRPFLGIKLYPWLAGNPYTQGENETIRHYQG